MGLDKPIFAGASSPVDLVEKGKLVSSSTLSFNAYQFSPEPHGLSVNFTPEAGKTYLIYGNGFIGLGGTQGTNLTSIYFSIKNSLNASNDISLNGLAVYEISMKG